jgi:hypothetical protein
MATYKVNYFIKRNNKEYEAHHIAEGTNAKEAIRATQEYTEAHHLPHPFRPTAKKMTGLELSSIDWKKDTITGNFRRDNAEELLFPDKMTPARLSEATTYCESIQNPFAEELMRRAGNLGAFTEATDKAEKGRILRNAAKAFGIMLF